MGPFYESCPELSTKVLRDGCRWRLAKAVEQSNGQLVRSPPSAGKDSRFIFKINFQHQEEAVRPATPAKVLEVLCSCCSSMVSNISNLPPVVPAHTGEYRDFANAQRFVVMCYRDDSDRYGSRCRCAHNGEVIRESHWSCCGNTSRGAPPCGESVNRDSVRYAHHIVCSTGAHNVCKRCLFEKIVHFNDQFKSGSRFMLTETGPILCPCNYVLPSKLAVLCIDDKVVLTDYVENVIKMNSEIIYAAYQRSLVKINAILDSGSERMSNELRREEEERYLRLQVNLTCPDAKQCIQCGFGPFFKFGCASVGKDCGRYIESMNISFSGMCPSCKWNCQDIEFDGLTPWNGVFPAPIFEDLALLATDSTATDEISRAIEVSQLDVVVEEPSMQQMTRQLSEGSREIIDRIVSDSERGAVDMQHVTFALHAINWAQRLGSINSDEKETLKKHILVGTAFPEEILQKVSEGHRQVLAGLVAGAAKTEEKEGELSALMHEMAQSICYICTDPDSTDEYVCCSQGHKAHTNCLQDFIGNFSESFFEDFSGFQTNRGDYCCKFPVSKKGPCGSKYTLSPLVFMNGGDSIEEFAESYLLNRMRDAIWTRYSELSRQILHISKPACRAEVTAAIDEMKCREAARLENLSFRLLYRDARCCVNCGFGPMVKGDRDCSDIQSHHGQQLEKGKYNNKCPNCQHLEPRWERYPVWLGATKVTKKEEAVNDEILATLMDMGFSFHVCVNATKRHGDNLERAVEYATRHCNDPEESEKPKPPVPEEAQGGIKFPPLHPFRNPKFSDRSERRRPSAGRDFPPDCTPS
jgi:hypothetical protein